MAARLSANAGSRLPRTRRLVGGPSLADLARFISAEAISLRYLHEICTRNKEDAPGPETPNVISR
jgi:hypothetical protein